MELAMALDAEDERLSAHGHHHLLPWLVRFEVFKLMDMMDFKVALLGPAILTRMRHEPPDEFGARRFEIEHRRYPVYLTIVLNKAVPRRSEHSSPPRRQRRSRMASPP